MARKSSACRWRHAKRSGAGRIHHRIGLRDRLHAFLDARQGLETLVTSLRIQPDMLTICQIIGSAMHRARGYPSVAAIGRARSPARHASARHSSRYGSSRSARSCSRRAGRRRSALARVRRLSASRAPRERRVHEADIGENVVHMADEPRMQTRQFQAARPHLRNEMEQRPDIKRNPNQRRRGQPGIAREHDAVQVAKNMPQYQTALITLRTGSRRAGPPSSTLVAMRPAKSLLK